MAKLALTTQIEGRVAILTLREVQALEANPTVRSLLLTTAHDTNHRPTRRQYDDGNRSDP